MFYNDEKNDANSNGNGTFGDYLVAELYAQIRMLRGYSAELNQHVAKHQIVEPQADETGEAEESSDVIDANTIDSSIGSEPTSTDTTEHRPDTKTNQHDSSNVSYFRPIVGPDSEFQAGWWSV